MSIRNILMTSAALAMLTPLIAATPSFAAGRGFAGNAAAGIAASRGMAAAAGWRRRRGMGGGGGGWNHGGVAMGNGGGWNHGGVAWVAAWLESWRWRMAGLVAGHHHGGFYPRRGRRCRDRRRARELERLLWWAVLQRSGIRLLRPARLLRRQRPVVAVGRTMAIRPATARSATAPTTRAPAPSSATTACGTPARKTPTDQGGAARAALILSFETHDRVASATPASVKASAAIWPGPSGSPSASADATTPITGTAMVPIAATEAFSRAKAANQAR